MNKRIIYFAPYNSSGNHPWYSSGANTKICQTLNTLNKISDKLIFVNFAPKESKKIFPNTINICSSLNKLIYCLEILFSFLSNRSILTSRQKQILIVYNPRFTSLLFFISSLLFGSKHSLIIQVEDIHGARKTSYRFLDKISFKILSKYAKHLFFAGEGMRNDFKEKNPYKKNISIYPPSLPKEFINIINNRKPPFSSEFLNIMYAGGFSKEKGIYELINVFETSNLINAKLNIYGYFPDHIKENYLNNKSIIFHGFVSQKELFMSYTETDIVVNPHKFILNNNYIFPYKNIEIFSSGALPLVSEQSIYGFNSLKIKDLCIFKDVNQLRNKLQSAKELWFENTERFQSSYKFFLKNYSEEKILMDVKNIIED